MKREKIQKLYSLLEEEVVKAGKVANEAKESANEIARSSFNSPSQSGDRFHSQGQAEIAEEMAARLSKMLNEIKGELYNASPEIVTPICYINLEYKNGVRESFYYLQEPISLSGNKFVSSKSAFGEALAGKKAGDSFNFSVGGVSRSGKVISIE